MLSESICRGKVIYYPRYRIRGITRNAPFSLSFLRASGIGFEMIEFSVL